MFTDRMVLSSSHRFSTVRLADDILILEGGRILEGGTHDDLIHRGGKYAQFFKIQASFYRSKEIAENVRLLNVISSEE
jgi:ATP-binding cassette, subfamily B, bacterial